MCESTPIWVTVTSMEDGVKFLVQEMLEHVDELESCYDDDEPERAQIFAPAREALEAVKTEPELLAWTLQHGKLRLQDGEYNPSFERVRICPLEIWSPLRST